MNEDPDPEVVAMVAIVEAFRELDDDACSRVLRWAGERYGIGVRKP